MKPSISSTIFASASAQHGAGHHGDLEAAVLGQRDERIGGAAAAGDGAGEQGALALEAGVVEAGAAADHGGQVGVAEAVGEQRGGGGVADAHLAKAEHVAAVGGQLGGEGAGRGPARRRG